MDTDTPLTTAADTPLPVTGARPAADANIPLLVTDTPLPVTGARPAADAFPAPLPGGVR
ncbi:hypothetical protein HG826_27120 [Streptomyces sp. GMY01]|uniref:hypothetical protein n=1 Tax=Streptomyces sp. GMY02 TaxID=1333528 RepID=UPI00146D53A6|nr:hypothetical protein [Streptomyces sp. GMY02]NMO37185.1 hypothetical protein [Streptomyces sp. GMY02]